MKDMVKPILTGIGMMTVVFIIVIMAIALMLSVGGYTPTVPVLVVVWYLLEVSVVALVVTMLAGALFGVMLHIIIGG